MAQQPVVEMRASPALPVARRQAGVGMVEVLVAVLILSIGVLGFAGMQLKALKSTGDTFVRSQAMVLASDIVSRIAVNPGQLATYSTAASWTSAPVTDAAKPTWWDTCVSASCTQAALAGWDINQSAWMAAHLLPNGNALVAQCTGASTYCVTVAWNKTTAANCNLSTGVADNGANKECVVLQVVL
jgi:type IV pilus assembly protein PilV